MSMQYVDVILDVKNNQSPIIWELLERMRPDRSSAMREYHEKALNVTSGHTEEDKDIFQAKYLPRFEYAVWLNEQLQNFRTEDVEKAKQYPYFRNISITSPCWSIELGCYPLPTPNAPTLAQVSLFYSTGFFWINPLDYRQTCIQLIHEMAEILGSTQALYFDGFGLNYEGVSTLYGNNYAFYDYGDPSFPYPDFIPLSDFIDRLAKEIGPPLDMNMKYPENELVPLEKQYTAYFVERF